MKCYLAIFLTIFVSTTADAVRFGAISSFTDVERVKYFTSTEGGGVDVINEAAYDVFTPYDGMYLWARYDRRLDSLSSILPTEGTIIVCCTGTPGWNTGWWSHRPELPAGERNQRFIDDYVYADFLEAMICRYGSIGVRELSQGRTITNWSLWGEPDGGQQMMGSEEYSVDEDDARNRAMIEYFNIASLASDRIRATDPNATIISGSFLSPASPPASSPYQWDYHARWCLQRCLAGEYNESGPVDFGWPEGPDVFDWHPYDDFVQNDNDIETYYDPLVIESNDMMYRVRCDQLANGFLDNLFTGANEPSWSTMPQYLLEFCPTYTLQDWRDHQAIVPDEFHSDWRANYHITSCLMLAESSHLDVLTPWLAGSGQWWAGLPGQSTYQCIPMPEALWPSPADQSYQFLTSRLNNLDCTSYVSSSLDRSSIESTPRESMQSGYRLAHWTFGQAPAEYPTVHALRTYRENDTFLYNENLCFDVSFVVPNSVVYLEQYSLTGNYEGNLIPDEYGNVTVSVNGYMKYAIEYTGSDWCESSATERSGEIQNNSSDIVRVRVYDLAGRLVVSCFGDTSIISENRNYLALLDSYDVPVGCYVIAVYNDNNHLLLSQKVTVLE